MQKCKVPGCRREFISRLSRDQHEREHRTQYHARLAAVDDDTDLLEAAIGVGLSMAFTALESDSNYQR